MKGVCCSVPDYRIFTFDQEHRLVDAELITCETDADALKLATDLLGYQHGVEVWEFDRFVGSLTRRPDDQADTYQLDREKLL